MSLRSAIGWGAVVTIGGVLLCASGCSSSSPQETVDSGPVLVIEAGKPKPDAKRMAAGDASGDAGACAPSTATYTAPPYVPAEAHQGVCTAAQVAAFAAACSSDTAACTDWQEANLTLSGPDAGPGTACGNCILPAKNNGAWWKIGAEGILPNTAACIQLTDPTPRGAACAAAEEDVFSCGILACEDCPGDPSVCEDAAFEGACLSYYRAYQSACAVDSDNGGALDTCSPNTVQQQLELITTLICGGDTMACPPESAASFQPPAYIPAVGHQGVCTASEISTFVAACGGGDPNTCNTWGTTNVAGFADGGAGTACGACLESGVMWTDSNDKWSANLGGCVQLTDARDGEACAEAIDAAYGCWGVACDSCPGTGPDDYVDCLTTADEEGGTCNSFGVAQIAACGSEKATAAVATCEPGGEGSSESLAYIATLICGGGTLACPPQSTSSLQPPAYVPAVGAQGACTASDITAFVAACGASSPGSDCSAWLNANAATATDGGVGTACGNCILPAANNGVEWATPNRFVDVDVAACVQLTDATNGEACAKAIEARWGCEAVACYYCPGAGADDLTNCVNTADGVGGSCNSVYAAENSACATDFAAGGAWDTCTPGGQGSDQALTYVATMICGAGVADAGQ